MKLERYEKYKTQSTNLVLLNTKSIERISKMVSKVKKNKSEVTDNYINVQSSNYGARRASVKAKLDETGRSESP